ncbi:uncharacterized protein AB675_3900 [Cyphellophora attinorum]|uniref:NAD dependent epimerase/dehydratase n=1 Tax=Cyphellophora attinorum TaxID=1664694 RepID=A0A0N1HL60_9EURO|nr:uncharacterized protein AB675_3900 [Phialophora attinorum]KPI37656.1 hypothetical protein AB675_3900 [Phialophora attinorum]
MGQSASLPEKGRKLQVIGAGLGRTGTTSFGHALSVLLDGPVYHGGTQMLTSPESHIDQWIKVFEHTPIKTEEDRQFVLRNTEELLDGFVGCTDLPANCLVEELMEIYPDAKVICTVRDPDKWWASMVLLYHDVLDEGRVGELYFKEGEPQRPTRAMYERHIEHLKKVVPKEKLMFFDVRDGWAPLCDMLGVAVPKGVPFPKMNDAQAMEDFMKRSIRRGLMAWTGILLGGGAASYYAGKAMKLF